MWAGRIPQAYAMGVAAGEEPAAAAPTSAPSTDLAQLQLTSTLLSVLKAFWQRTYEDETVLLSLLP